ncbi:MAG: helix-turn-helix transcriptional regulator [Oscillospiraceae bacterium]
MKIIDNLHLYPNLIKVRENLFTQKEVAEYLGLSQQDISRYETGNRKAPINYIKDLAELCNSSVDFILGLEIEHPVLSEDENEIIQKWRLLSERQKGKVEQLVETILEADNKQSK